MSSDAPTFEIEYGQVRMKVTASTLDEAFRRFWALGHYSSSHSTLRFREVPWNGEYKWDTGEHKKKGSWHYMEVLGKGIQVALSVALKLDHQQKLLEGPEGMHTSINWHAYSIDRPKAALCEVISVMREYFVGPMRTFPTASEERPERELRELVVGNKAAHEVGKSRLRKFRSHKIVEAEAIYSTMPPGHVPYVTVAHSPPYAGLERVPVPAAFFARGTPMPGDYLVRYSDGYLSWSPKKAFEEGYTEIAEPADPSTPSTQDANARDAARWRALMASPLLEAYVDEMVRRLAEKKDKD